MSNPSGRRLGIDLGGTKMSGIVLDAAGAEVARDRRPSPKQDYAATIRALCDLVADLETRTGAAASIGIGMPGSISKRTGKVQNANSTWLNGQPLQADLEAALGRPVRLANDANCFAVSEAFDGAARGAASVFGVILGTGCGGGLVLEGRIVDGPRAIGGEWGHNPLPWATADEHPGPLCWCGRRGCMETWVSGSGLSADHGRITGQAMTGEAIVSAAAGGDPLALATLDRHAGRLARGLAHVVNIIDPEVIVLGGGLSNVSALYATLPALMAPYVFADAPEVAIRPPRWGDDSGVRGAARLWS